MIKPPDQYTYRVTWSQDDHEYVGLCAEFPSLSWLETTQLKALKGVRQLVQNCLNDLQTEHQSAPEPISIKPYSGKFMIQVTPEKHRLLALQAAESGVSLNRLVSRKLG